MDKTYDAIVIGAGMSGLATAIRLAMFDQRVCVVEAHSIPGGLNSYYQRRNIEEGGVRLFDVGLHALTNYVPKGTKAAPLTKLLKQLRIDYDLLKLCPQSFSKIAFPGKVLQFTNEFTFMEREVALHFPDQVASFKALVEKVRHYDELTLEKKTYQSSRAVLSEIFSNPLLAEMLLAPLLIYGSAWENDMDFGQFVVMFKSIYMEGFARPEGGVRTIIHLLMEKAEEVGVEFEFRNPVFNIISRANQVVGVETKNGVYYAPKVFSSAGLPETYQLAQVSNTTVAPRVGNLSFVEGIFVFDDVPNRYDIRETIVFYNSQEKYRYQKSADFYDAESAVICFPDNYEMDASPKEGTIRLTFMANYELWKSLDKEQYTEKKEQVAQSMLSIISRLYPQFPGKLLFKDIFTPTTIERYTKHASGTVYGSPDKVKDGRTAVEGLFVMGTDQGFLGIVGSMLSGISMANFHGLMESK